MTIREATIEDAFDVMVLSQQFTKEGPGYFKFNKDKVSSFFSKAISDPSMVIFLSEDNDGVNGFIAGCYTDHPYNDIKAAVELGWFVTKEKRDGTSAMRLVRSFERWSKDIGAEWTAMSDIVGVQDLSKLYERAGYHAVERTFMKEVS
jgi:hypothetical protein